MQAEMIKWIGDKFAEEHVDEDRDHLLTHLKDYPNHATKVIKKRAGLFMEAWARKHPERVLHIRNNSNNPDAFEACAKQVMEYLQKTLQEEIAGVSN